jgi:hypothetical protein
MAIAPSKCRLATLAVKRAPQLVQHLSSNIAMLIKKPLFCRGFFIA